MKNNIKEYNIKNKSGKKLLYTICVTDSCLYIYDYGKHAEHSYWLYDKIVLFTDNASDKIIKIWINDNHRLYINYHDEDDIDGLIDDICDQRMTYMRLLK